MAVDEAALHPGACVRLPGVTHAVELVSVSPGAFWTLYFDSPQGPGKLTLAEDELDQIELVEQTEELRFDGDPRQFRLGVEARRIDIAFAWDMAGVAVSNIQPLPHQLEAVYDTFLPQPHLRFLLADDPGAGKTIMAGLYMKELILRKAGDRIVVVTPANLRPQWIRELSERFQLDFVQLNSAQFEASLTENPWDQFDRIVVSRDFLRQEHIREAFEAADMDWDLAVVDEAHGFTLSVDGKGHIRQRSERYKAAEAISRKAVRLILMTATPHSGRTESLWALLRLLDLDAWGDRCPRSLDIPTQAFRKVSKEIMTDMTGKKLFKERHPETVAYQIRGDEWDLYNAVTDFVSEKLREIKGDRAHSAAGFALTTMQRRVASSTRAIRRTLERRIDRIQTALDDPEEYLRNRREFQRSLIDDDADLDILDEMDEEARWELEEEALQEWLPDTIFELEQEKAALEPILVQAQDVEAKTVDGLPVEKKLRELLEVVRTQGLREDRRKQILIFTEHKDTLDYLVEHLQKDFEVAQIHGQMKLAERIEQERFFRERAQIMVATEAAGEGINLQFCHLMVNYDIPWNPNRLEQRMGRIHRIGQTEDVYIFNLVAANTREGAVLVTLLRKLERMGDELGDKVFDVVGQAIHTNLREVIEAVLTGEMSSEEAVASFGGEEADPETVKRADELLQSALARHHLDWETERERHARAEERRLPPSYFERFFLDAMDYAGGIIEKRLDPGTFRVERSPDHLVAQSRLTSELRQIAPAYARLTFDKAIATRPRRGPEEAELPMAELCGPGHPLFDSLVRYAGERTLGEVERGAIFFDPDLSQPTILRFFEGDVVDGNSELVRRTLAMARQEPDGKPLKSPTASLYDVVPATDDPAVEHPDRSPVPPVDADIETWARQHLFETVFQEVRAEREATANIQGEFLEQSFAKILARADEAIITVEEDVDAGVTGSEGRLRKAELAKEQQLQKRNSRMAEVERGRRVTRGAVSVIGSALLLPLPEPEPGTGGTDRDADVEQTAIRISIAYEEQRGADAVRSVEDQNCGFDLLSIAGPTRRCIEVKGRAGVGRVELTWSEFAKAQELGDDYWLYVVLDCATSNPRLYRVNNPAMALAGAWEPSLDVRYGVGPEPVIEASEV